MKSLLFSLVVLLSSFSTFAGSKIQFSVEPGFEKIGPDVTVAKLKFKLPKDQQGNNLRIELWSPKKDPILSTDFPIVEGTKLIDSHITPINGTLELDYLFPIRGEYRLRLTRGLPGQEIVQEERFSLNENPEEVTNILVLVGILIIFGLISGLVLGRGARSKALAENGGMA